MENWFSDLETIEECKAQYRVLSKTMHPDMGGDEELFNAMYDAYRERCKQIEEENKPIPEEYVALANALGKVLKVKFPKVGDTVSKAAVFAPLAVDMLVKNKKKNKYVDFLGKIDF